MSEAEFSISTAVATPFRLVRRRPIMVLVWGLAMVLFGIVAVALILPMLASFPINEMIEDDSAALNAMMGSMIQMQAVSALLNLGQFALSLVLWAAITRATLGEGQTDKWFFMRLSMDEVWLLIVGFAVFIGLYAAMLVLMLFGAAIGFGVWGLGEPINIIVIMVVGLACVAILLIAMARVSLIAPACILYKRLAFPEGWRLAKGQTGRLLLLLLAVWAIYMALYVVIAAALIAVVIGSGGFANLDRATTLADILPNTGTIAVWIVVAILPLSAVSGFVLTLFVSPFASACQQLVRMQPNQPDLATPLS